MSRTARGQCAHCRRRPHTADTRPHRVVDEWIVLDNCAHAEWPGFAFAQVDQDGNLAIGPVHGSPYTAFVVPAAVIRLLMTRHRQVKAGKISGRVDAA